MASQEDNIKALQDQTLLLSEVIIKLAALEQLLMSKGIITEQDLGDEVKKVVEKLSNIISTNITNSIVSTNGPEN